MERRHISMTTYLLGAAISVYGTYDVLSKWNIGNLNVDQDKYVLITGCTIMLSSLFFGRTKNKSNLEQKAQVFS